MDQMKMETSSYVNDYCSTSNHQRKGLQWTNEKHSSFLSSMEANFVRNMMERSSNAMIFNKNTTTTYNDSKGHDHDEIRLDRFLPDISESTLDSHTRKPSTSAMVRVSNSLTNRPSRFKKQRRQPHPFLPSHDQVVPKLDNRTGDMGEN